MLSAMPKRSAVGRATAPIEGRILVGAQRAVDAWFQADNRGPFSRAMSRAIERQWPSIGSEDPRRLTFMRVAEAIRVGRGHAFAEPAPLIRIIRKTLSPM